MNPTDAVSSGASQGGDRGARDRRPQLLVAVVCGVYAVGAATGWGSAGLATVMGDFGLAGAALAAALSCLVNACFVSGRARPAWLLFGVSSLMLALGNGTWGWYEVVLHAPVPTPSAADYAFLFFAPSAIIGLLVLAHRPHTAAGWLCLVLDGWLIAGSLFTLSWSLALARAAHGDEGSPLRMTMALAYPLLDILLVSLVLGLRFRRRDGNRAAVNTAMLALALTVVCDALWTFPALRNSYHSGEFLDAGWFAGSVLLAWAPWAPRWSRRRGPAPAAPSAAGQRRRVASTFSALPPYLAAGVCTAALLHNALGHRSLDRVVLVTGCTVVLALIVRQGVMLLDNLSLAQELAQKEAHFRSLVQGSSDVIMIAGPDGVLSYVSPASSGVYERNPEELVGGRLLDLVHPADIGHVLWEVRRFLAKGPGVEPTARVECRIRSGSGEWLHVESTVNRHRDGLIFNCRDVTERVLLQAQLQHNAFHDPLTDLPNRALFTERVREALAEPPGDGSTAAVLFLDLDGFKSVNDTAGHQVGDELLVHAARRLQSAIRDGDTVARLGGDEFAALVCGRLDEKQVRDLAERLGTALSEPYWVGGIELGVAASIGIAFREPGAGPAELMRNADLAMYRAKSAGKGRVALYSPQLRSDLVRRTEMEQRLSSAVREGRLTLLHQPVVDLASGHVIALEAQARWRSAQGALLTPAEFMPSNEHGNRAERFTRWLVQQSITEAAARRRRGRTSGSPEVPVTVQLPAQRLTDPGMLETIDGALIASGLPPGQLILAVAAAESTDGLEELASRLAALRRLGVRLALEGFGTAQGSLASLHRLPVDILKLDRTLVDGVAESAFSRTLAGHLLRLGRDLGLATVAEGVDLPGQAAVLRQLGCRSGQGLLFAGPLEEERLRRVLLRRNFPVPRPAGAELPRLPAPAPDTRLPGGYAPVSRAEGRSEARAAHAVRHDHASDVPERASGGGPHDETPVPPA